MSNPVLEDVKIHLNLEGINDFDSLLSRLLTGAIARAENETGRNFTNVSDLETYEVMNPEIYKAVLMDVATGFDSRQDNSEGMDKESVNASIYTYRKHSKRPMF